MIPFKPESLLVQWYKESRPISLANGSFTNLPHKYFTCPVALYVKYFMGIDKNILLSVAVNPYICETGNDL
jgi:hypothetical protein